MDEEETRNIRYFLGVFIGKKLVDVTQHDREEFNAESGRGAFVELLFEDGMTIHLPVLDEPFSTDHADKCDCECCQDTEGTETA